MATIEVTGLRKRFGRTQALDGMTFTVAPGEVTGFVGPNGAGKSTTMRVILGLDAADAGSALVGGQPYASLRHPFSQVGALLDAGGRQPARSARNHQLWLARSQGLGAGRVDEVVAQAGLESVVRRKAGGYSLGMRQRLGIAAALLGDPPVLMLDEPFNGALAISGLAAERIVALLAAQAIPFSEVSAQQASLEQAYLELTGQAAEFRAAPANTVPTNTVPANTVATNTVPANTGAAS
jgi:ABC-type Na+ transport system ATPase subunit NatA